MLTLYEFCNCEIQFAKFVVAANYSVGSGVQLCPVGVF